MTDERRASAGVPERADHAGKGTPAAPRKRRMSGRNADPPLPAVETLAATSSICSDRTGTLTRNEMTARRVVSPGEHRISDDAGPRSPEGHATSLSLIHAGQRRQAARRRGR